MLTFDTDKILSESIENKVALYKSLEKIMTKKRPTDADKFICQICIENEIELSFEKCGHVVCNSCSKKMRNICPFCKTHSSYKKLHFC